MAVKILITGGTLDAFDYAREADAPGRKYSIVPRILRQARITCDYSTLALFLKDSKFITAKDRELIAKSCRNCKEKRILITHGSITMAATAKFLAKKKTGKTIVLTGAITPFTKRRSDSLFNIGFAFAAAQLLPQGVYVAMNGRVFAANNVKKNLRTQVFEEER
ncbi:MAG: asparaginase domain-containing protein [Candidatus Micrarchaeia archaeon]